MFNHDAAMQAVNEYAGQLGNPVLQADFSGRAESTFTAMKRESDARAYREKTQGQETFDDASANGYAVRGASAWGVILTEKIRAAGPGTMSSEDIFNLTRAQLATFINDNQSIFQRPEQQAAAMMAFDRVTANTIEAFEQQKTSDNIAVGAQEMTVDIGQSAASGANVEDLVKKVRNYQAALRQAGASRERVSQASQLTISIMLDTAVKTGDISAIDRVERVNASLPLGDQLEGIGAHANYAREQIRTNWATTFQQQTTKSITAAMTLDDLREIAVGSETVLTDPDEQGYRGSWKPEDTANLEAKFLKRQDEIIAMMRQRKLKPIEDSLAQSETNDDFDADMKRLELLRSAPPITLLDGTEVPAFDSADLEPLEKKIRNKRAKFEDEHAAAIEMGSLLASGRGWSSLDMSPGSVYAKHWMSKFYDRLNKATGPPTPVPDDPTYVSVVLADPMSVMTDMAIETGAIPETMVAEAARLMFPVVDPTSGANRDEALRGLNAYMRLRGASSLIADKIAAVNPLANYTMELDRTGMSRQEIVDHVAQYGADRVRVASDLVSNNLSVTGFAEKGNAYARTVQALATKRMLFYLGSGLVGESKIDAKNIDAKSIEAIEAATEEAKTFYRTIQVNGYDVTIPRNGWLRDGSPAPGYFDKVDPQRLENGIALYIKTSGLALGGWDRDRVRVEPDSLSSVIGPNDKIIWRMRVRYMSRKEDKSGLGPPSIYGEGQWVVIKEER